MNGIEAETDQNIQNQRRGHHIIRIAENSSDNNDVQSEPEISCHNFAFQLIMTFWQFLKISFFCKLVVSLGKNDILKNPDELCSIIVKLIFDVVSSKYSNEISERKPISRIDDDNKTMPIICAVFVIMQFAIGLFMYLSQNDISFAGIMLICVLSSIWVIAFKLQIFLRYFENAKTAWRFKRRASSDTSNQRIRRYKDFTETNGDIAFINIIGDFLPMTINQIIRWIPQMKKCPDLEGIFNSFIDFNNFLRTVHITLNRVDSQTDIFKVFSWGFSLIFFFTIAWSLTARARAIKAKNDDKTDLSIPRSLVLCFAHFFFIVSKSLIISWMLETAPWIGVIGLVIHWVGGVVYVWLTAHEDTTYIVKPLHCAIFGLIYVFTMIIPANNDKPTKILYLKYYGISFLELLTFSIFWYFIQDCYPNHSDAFSIISVMFSSFFIGVAFFIAYYKCFKSPSCENSAHESESFV